MARTICPQVKGIYHNKNAPDGYDYLYLYIPEHHPDSEYWVIDAYECTKYGCINPSKHTPEPHLATDFGDYYQF